MRLQLPEASIDAMQSSRALHDLIANEIRKNSGWISFERFMDLALYAPGLGYYSGGSAKLGKDGDFTTAPEIASLFGATLAHVAANLMSQSRPHIMEFGAGTGKLAFDILTELAANGISVDQYDIVELSGELRARQQHALRDFPQVRWLDSMPAAYSGVVIGNEVLDAMPVHLVIRTRDGWRERGVTLDSDEFKYSDRTCDASLVSQIPDADALPVNYLTEVHPVALGFMQSLSAMLSAGYQESGKGGAALLIDYGFPAHEYYLSQRSEGTLMCHYRHHAHPDPFYLPGLQDITAHVDFTAAALAAVDAGTEVLAYMSQASFLLSAGLGDLLQRTPASDKLRYLPQANQVHKLTSPAEMGELFKVLVIGKGIELPANIVRSDRSYTL